MATVHTFIYLHCTELFGAMVFSFFLAVLYEGLKTLKDLLAKKMNTFASVPIASINSESNLRTFIPYRYSVYNS